MATAKGPWLITIVQNENGTCPRGIAGRRAMPVMIPGSAIGRMMTKDTADFPKKRVRHTAAAARVPRIRAMAVAVNATRIERLRALRTSGLFHATENQWVVRLGGGGGNDEDSVVNA